MGAATRADIELLAREAVDCGLQVHKDIGPGLLESVYEIILADALTERGLRVERQKPVNFVYRGQNLGDAFRIDLLIERKLIIELKSVERLLPLHGKQLLTYLRLSELPLGLLMNFGAEVFRDGLKRVSNNYFGDWKSS